MKKRIKQSDKLADIRIRAEEVVHKYTDAPHDLTSEDTRTLIEELKIHQIELEMQNEELRKSQQELEESRTKYSALYNFAPVGYFTFDVNGIIKEVNLTGAEMLGVERSKLIKTPFSLYIAPESKEVFQKCLADIAEFPKRVITEIKIMRKNDKPFYAQAESTAILDNDGKWTQFRTVIMDITERKQIEDAQLFLAQCGYLYPGEDFFESLARYLAQNLGMDYVCIDRLLDDNLTAQTVAIYYDGKFEDNVKYTLKDTPCGDVVGKNVCCFPKNVRHLFPQDAVLQEMKAESYVGTTLWSFDGKPIGLIAVIGRKPLINQQLITSLMKLVSVRAAGELERQRSEEALLKSLENIRKSEAEVSALLNGSKTILKCKKFEDAARSIFNSCKDLLGADSGYVALLSDDGQENEVLFLESGGRPCTVNPNLPMPIRGLRSEAYHSGKVVYHNDFMNSKWVGYMPEGHVTLDNVLFAPLNIEGKTAGIMGIANKPGGFNDDDARLAASFGELAAIALKNSRTLEALNQSEEKFRTFMETAGEFIYIVDEKTRITYANAVMAKTLGYTEEELIGMHIKDILAQKETPFETKFKTLVSTGRITFEDIWITKDGKEIHGEVSVVAIYDANGNYNGVRGIFHDITDRKVIEDQYRKVSRAVEQANDSIVITDRDGNIQFVNPAFERITGYSQAEAIGQNPRVLKSGKHSDEFYKNMWMTILKSETWHGNLINKKKNGELFYEEATISPVKNKNNEIVNLVAIKRDVSKRIELENNIARLRRENETFMRHEIKNLLSPVKGYSELLLYRLNDNMNEKQMMFLTKIKENIDHTVLLVDYLKELQDFELGRVELKKTLCNLNSVILGVLSDLTMIAEQNKVVILFDSKAPNSKMQMDCSLIPGVFNNLIKNAIEHVSGLTGESERIVKVTLVTENGKIIAKINNRGEPVTPDKLELFFEKFNSDRTKKKDGTGLGTTYAYLVTKAHGGDIAVESNEKEGTTITVSFNIL